MTPEFSILHQKATLLAQTYRKQEALLLEVLIEIDRKRAYLPLGYSSLFQYCVSALNLTESQSYAFMAISRKSVEVPELKAAVEKNEITVSNARKLVSVITPENKETWLEKGRTLTQASLEREIVKENPLPPVQERVRSVSDSESELRVGLDAEMEKDLARVKAILGASSAKEALKAMLKDYLKRHDPVKKAERAADVARPAQLGVRPVGRYIPRPAFHEVQKRDQGRCQFKAPGGKICGTERWVEIHHLQPWSHGGKHEAQNLLTLCSQHHRYWHR